MLRHCALSVLTLALTVRAQLPATVPSTMREVHRDGSVNCTAPTFACISVQRGVTPVPGRGFALIKVSGSAISHDDLTLCRNCTLGLDVSGIVVSVGEACVELKVGDRAWYPFPASIPSPGSFGMADYATIVCAYAGRAPFSIDLALAGTFPANAQTSLGAFRRAGAPWGQGRQRTNNFTVLIVAGTGGTGYSGVQLARTLGATMVVTAAGHADGVHFVRNLGADIVVDYHKSSVFDAVPDGSVDLVYDNLGRPEDVDKAMAKLKSPGGTWVGIVPSNWNGSSHPPNGVRQITYNVWSPTELITQKDKLDALADFVDAGKIMVYVNMTYDFAHIKEAYNQFANGHVLSRVGVVPGRADFEQQATLSM